MNVEDYDPTVPFYAIANEDYQDVIPAGTVVIAQEIDDPLSEKEGGVPDPDRSVWQLRNLADRGTIFGRYAIVPTGSQAELFLRTGQVARPGTQG